MSENFKFALRLALFIGGIVVASEGNVFVGFVMVGLAIFLPYKHGPP
jgi:hypothetical protein